MNTKDRIKKCLKQIMDDSFEIETGFISDAWIDSFTLLRLIKVLEDEFEIKIELKEVTPENFNDIDSIIEIVNHCTHK